MTLHIDPKTGAEPVSDAIGLLCELLELPSVTPEDAGCQDVIARRLSNAGFHIEFMPFGNVRNLWACYGSEGPRLCFAGHTDVVPPGDRDLWQSDPFTATVRDEHIYGRGVVDMKGGLAAMISATETFLKSQPEIAGSIAFLITSDEEGDARNGTRQVMKTLVGRGENIDWCVIGEPSSSRFPGDTIRIGRRGSLNGTLVVRGIQGHVAYPELADNPVHRLAVILAELSTITWDSGDEYFPPTGFEVTSLQAGVDALNVIPSSATARFNFRHGSSNSPASLRRRVEAVVSSHARDFDIQWDVSGEPFLTQGGPFIDAVSGVIEQECGAAPDLSTAGGTSDGRFIASYGIDVIELGLVNATAHKVNENSSLAHVDQLCALYLGILRQLMTGPNTPPDAA